MKILQVANFFKPLWGYESMEMNMPLNNRQYLKMNVIIIGSDRAGLFIRPIRIARYLVRNGHEVEFLMWDRTGSRPKIEYIEGCKVDNFRLKPPNLGVGGLIPGYLLWCFYVTLSLLRKDADLYHPVNLYNLIPVIPVKIVRRKKIIYDLIDFVADSFNWHELIRMFFAWLENFCLKFADGVIVVDIRKQQLNMANVKKLAVVTNCPVDLMDKFEPQKAQDEFVIYYGGWISETRGLKHVCEAIRDIDGVKLIVAGFGPDEVKLRPVFDAQSNVEFIGLLSDVESLEWTSRVDVIFAFYDPKIQINRLASPAKLYDAMMCGTSILVNSEALPVTETVRKEGCGLVVPYNDIQGIRSAIEKLKEDPELKSELGQNGRKAFEREYNWTVMESRLLRLYDEISFSKGANI